MPRLPARTLRTLARKATAAFNQHTRSCPDCTPPSGLCWLGAALDEETSRAAAMAMDAEATERRRGARQGLTHS